MALTLFTEQRLERAGLVPLFNDHRATWFGYARRVYRFVRENFPAESVVRMDDVAESLLPLISVEQILTDYLAANKLRQKYWTVDFSSLIVDHCWEEISQ